MTKQRESVAMLFLLYNGCSTLVIAIFEELPSSRITLDAATRRLARVEAWLSNSS